MSIKQDFEDAYYWVRNVHLKDSESPQSKTMHNADQIKHYFGRGYGQHVVSLWKTCFESDTYSGITCRWEKQTAC